MDQYRDIPPFMGHERAKARLDAVRAMLAENGCDCPCEHHWEEHDDDCERCLACRIAAVVDKQEGGT
jgi:hypothetical protein